MTLFAGFAFGVFGAAIFNMGRKRNKFVPMALGIGLMIYPYFIENPYVMWGLGAVLMTIGIKSL